MNILITGSSGFIGSYLANYLNDKHNIYVINRHDNISNPGLNNICCDLTLPFSYDILPNCVDVVIHLAQSRNYRNFPGFSEDIYNVNVHSTFRLLEYARKVGAKKFVLASSGGVYGFGSHTFNEQSPVAPGGFYQCSKTAAESLAQGYQSFFTTIILRPFFVYGPLQQGMLIPSLIEKVAFKKTITIEGDPGLHINPLYVDDAVRAIDACINHDVSEIFNLAGDESISISGLVELISAQLGMQACVEHSPALPGQSLLGDNTKMKQILGVFPDVSLHEGISKMIQANITRKGV